MRWGEKILYVVVFLVTALSTAFFYYFFTYHFLLPLGRSTTFLVSFSLILFFMVVAIFEDRFLWHGIFDPPQPVPWARVSKGFRVAPSPISMGIIVGVGSFMVWS